MEARRNPHPGRLAAWLVFVALYATAAYAAYFIGPRDTTNDELYRYETAVSGAVVFAVLLGIALAIAGAGGGPARRLLGLRRPRSWKLAAGLAALVLVAVYALAAALAQLGLDPGREQGLLPETWRRDRLAPYAANFLLITTFVPVVEEFLFRGLGYSLLRPFGRVFAIVSVGVLFAAAHGLVEAFPLLALFGIGLAWIRDRTASVVPCIVLHGLFNAVALLVVVAQPEAAAF